MNQQMMMNGQQKKSILPFGKGKKEAMAAEMEMMKQMQAQKQAMQSQQQQQNVRPGQKVNNYNDRFTDETLPDMTVQDWIITLVMLIIPGFNIYLIVKGMNEPMNPPYKQNFYKAFGLYFAASFIVSIIISLIMSFV